MDLSHLAANSKMRAGVSPATMEHACRTVQFLISNSKTINSLFLTDIAALRVSQLVRNCIESQIRAEWEDVKHIELVLSLIYSAAVDAVNKTPVTVDEVSESIDAIVKPIIAIIKQSMEDHHAANGTTTADPGTEVVPGPDNDQTP